MKEFAFCVGDDSLMATLTRNWNFWMPKIIKKAKLESGGRSKLFENCCTLINQLADKSPEEFIDCEYMQCMSAQ